MTDYTILKNPMGGYVILAPRRAKRPDESESIIKTCPFCIGNEAQEKELFRIGGQLGDENWQIRVLENKFPFAPVHELIIHSPDHHKNLDELPLEQVQLIFYTFQERFNRHVNVGTVFIFSNHGELGGESLPHPHSQLVVLPFSIDFIVPEIIDQTGEIIETELFTIHAPFSSQWPDEVWIMPKNTHKNFGQISKNELNEISFILHRLIQIFTLKHGHEFPFNFYIYPKNNWYLRFIPREKKLGGLEIASNIFVNTEDPYQTIKFIKDNF